MSVETRHTEKSILFMLLEAEKTGDVRKIINYLMSVMEQDDVEVVLKRFADNENSK